MIIKKLIIAVTFGFLFSLKVHPSISLYSSQFSTLKGLVSSLSKVEKNVSFHISELKKENLQPLSLISLKFADEDFLVSKEMLEVEAFLDQELDNNEQSILLKKNSFQNNMGVDNFVNDEDKDIDEVLGREVKQKNIGNKDSLTFYDYSKKNNKKSEKLEINPKLRKRNFSSVSSEKISNVVKMAIKRELKEPIGTDYVTLNSAKNIKKSLNKINIFSRKSIINNLNESYPESYFDLNFFSLKFNKRKEKTKLFNLEFRPHYNKSKRLTDSGSGKIELREYPFNKFSTLAGATFHHGSMITRIRLPISEGIKKRNIPLLDISSYEEFLDKNDLKGIGGSILVDFRDEGPLRIQIDSSFEKKIYLDSNFNVSEFFGNHRFTFFIGVDPGNILLTLMKSKEKFSEKIIFVENSEVTYEYPEIENGSIRKVSLYKKNVMGNRNSVFSIDEDKVKVFNQPNIPMRKIGLNLYEFKIPFSEKGKREYLRLDHLDKSFYIGIGNGRKVIIPSDGFMQRVLGSFGLENLEKRCLVQINLKNAPSEVWIDGESSLGPIDIETRFLDKEGVFEADVENLNELTNQIFVLGDLQGVINARINYINGQSDHIETICSSDDYLVEQL